MNYAQQRSAIETKFLTGWDSKTTPVKFDNVHGYRRGSEAVDDETCLEEMCHLRIENQTATYGAINVRMVRHGGAVVITLFAKSGAGSHRVRELADKVSSLMVSDENDDLIFYPAEVMSSFPTPDSDFFQMVIQVPFVVDQYR